MKNGDGAADIKPIAHLYKTQVYQLAEFLGVPAEIRSRPPTTDTYSLPQTQDEFYFSLPYDKMDLCLCGKDNGIPSRRWRARPGFLRCRSSVFFATSTRNSSTPSTCTRVPRC